MIRKKEEPKTSIITVNWNCARLIHNSIDTLCEHSDLNNIEIIWIDNNSHPNDYNYLKYLKSCYHDFDITLIRNSDNLGFAKACNLGAKYANGKYVAFVNPDTAFVENTISVLVEKLEEDPKIGLIAPKILSEDLKPMKSAGKINTILSIALGESFLPSLGGYYENDNNPFEPGWVLGSFMILPKNVFDKVGGFDERYFMYAEEADLCLKIRKAGYKVVYYPKTKVVHLGEGAARKVPDLTARRKMASEFKFFSKWRGVWYACANAFVNSFTSAVRASAYTFIALFGKEKADLLADKYRKFSKYRIAELFKSFFESNTKK